MADVGDVVADSRLLDPGPERLLADVEQALGLRRDLADSEGVGAVGDQAVERDPEVDRHDIARLCPVIRRDPVHDHRVRGNAERCRVAPVALRGRDAAALPDVFLCKAVELEHRDSGAELLGDHLQRVGDDVAGARHALDLGLGLAEDHLTPTCSSAAWISAKTSFGVPSAWTGTRTPSVR